MQAWQFTTASGGLDKNLKLNHNATIPVSTSGQVLIEVVTMGVNPIDYKIAEFPIVGRLFYGSPASPGLDYSGRVAASNGHDFKEGQRVFGRLDKPQKYGTLAQFIVAGREVAVVPEGVNSDIAAAVGTAGLTAYQCLRIGGAGPGSKVFINGGSGGVGTWGIQHAKAMGSEVTTSCSTRNVELCKSLGADIVIDYSKQDLIQTLKCKGQYFDVVVDNVGLPGPLYREADHFLKPGCKFVQVGASVSLASGINILGRKFWPTILGNGSRSWHFHDAVSSRQDLDQIGKWLVEGKVKPIIDRTVEWANAPEAYTYLKTGKAHGKILVHVESETKA
jgi:NADPH:quinone reductase-like Zn-dependent oxidoreductase